MLAPYNGVMKPDPVLQFLIVLVLAPILAILGTSLGQPLAGWLATLCLWGGFAVRAARQQRRGWQGNRFPLGVEGRLWAGISVFAVLVWAGVVTLAGAWLLGSR